MLLYLGLDKVLYLPKQSRFTPQTNFTHTINQILILFYANSKIMAKIISGKHANKNYY